MPGESIILDPTSEDASNVQLDIVDNVSYFLLEHEYPLPDLDAQYASSVDTEGDVPASIRPRNRTITAKLRVIGTTSADLEQKLAALWQKLGKFNREGGTYKRTTPSGAAIVFDLLPEATGGCSADTKYISRFRATVDLKFVAKPYWRGTPIGPVTDDFSTNTIGNYTFDAGAGTLAVSGGQLVPSTSAEKRLVRNTGGVDNAGGYYDAQVTVKFTTDATPTAVDLSIVLKRLDANNQLWLQWPSSIAQLRILKFVAGVATSLSTPGTPPALAANTSYWLRGRIEGNLVTAEIFTAAPTASSTAAATSTFTLSAGDATQFGRGVAGKVGLRIANSTSYRYDDLTVEPNTWVEKTLPALVGTAYGLPGDVEGLGKLTITNSDAAAVDWWWLMWGLQSRYTDQSATAQLFYEAEALTAQGGSAIATRAGASPAGSASNNVMRNAGLTTTYQSILSTQLASGGSHLSHIGDYQIIARIWDPSASVGVVTARLDWTTGDFRQHTLNPENQAAIVGGFALIDLGQVHLPKAVAGLQRWEGRILAKSTSASQALEIDCLALIPITEGSGRAAAVVQPQNPTSFTARDEFDQTAGALSGKTMAGVAPDTWTRAGDADDFAVETTGHTAQRTATADAAGIGCYEFITSASLTATFVQVDLKASALTDALQGVLARYNSATSNLIAYANQSVVSVRKQVAGSFTTIKSTSLAKIAEANAWYTLSLVVDAAGRLAVWFNRQGQPLGTPLIVAQDAALIQGGTLGTGPPGLYDENQGGAVTRNYDNFIAYVPALDAVAYASRTIEIRNDRAIRQDSGGTYYGPLAKYEGDYQLIPPAAREGRATRFMVLKSRNDPTTMGDPAIDDAVVQLTYVPRGLVTPE